MGFSDRSDSSRSNQYSQIGDNTDLLSEFMTEDKVTTAVETAKSVAMKEAEELMESRVKQLEEEKELQLRLAQEEVERKAALLIEDKNKLYEQLLFSEAQIAEKERCIKMDAEISSLKAEGAIQAAAEEAERRAQEAQMEAQRMIELERLSRLT